MKDSSKVFDNRKFDELVKEYQHVIYADDGLYICYILGIGWELHSNNNYLGLYLDFDKLISSILKIKKELGEKDD